MAYLTAGAAIGGLAYATYSGETQAAQQRKGLRKQSAAQDEAESQASRAERQAMEAQQRASRETPDLMATYDREQRRKGAGAPPLASGGGSMLGGNSLLGV